MYLPQSSSHRPESERLPPLSSTGQVRVLVVGDSGVGKSSIVHLITQGEPTRNPPRTVGCNVSLKYVEHSERAHHRPLGTRYSTTGFDVVQRLSPSQGSTGSRQGYFVELWDVSGHEEYKSSRSLFYNQINGVIFVHDLSRRKSRVSALHWLGEVAKMGTFSSPSMPRRPGLLPVPLLVIGNKVDVPEIDPVLKGANWLWRYLQGSKGVRAAKLWAERNQILGFGRATDLPDYIRNPHSSGLIACAREGRLDMHAVMSFFVDLIERRYFMESMPPLPSPSKSWTDPYFSKLSSSHSGESGAHAPRPPYLGLDPLFSAVHSEESRPAFLPGGVKASASNDWGQSSDQYELRIDADSLTLSDSHASLASFEGVPEPRGVVSTSRAAGAGPAPVGGASIAYPRATSPAAPGLHAAGLKQLQPTGLPAPLQQTFHASGLQALPGVADGERGGTGKSEGAPLGWSREEGRSEASLAPSSSWGSFSLAQEELGIGMGTRAPCPGPTTPPFPPPQAKLLSPGLSILGEGMAQTRDGTNGADEYRPAGQLGVAHPTLTVQSKHRPASVLPGNGSVDARDGRNGAAQSHTGGVSMGNGLPAQGTHHSRHDGHALPSRGGASDAAPGPRVSSGSAGTGHSSSKGTLLRPSPQHEQPADGAHGARDKGGGERVTGHASGLVSSGPLWQPQAPDSHRLRAQEDSGTSPHAPYSQRSLPSHSRDLLDICA